MSQPTDTSREALRRLIEERRRARRQGARQDVKRLSKQLQKEARAISRAARTAKVQTILEEFKDICRIAHLKTSGKTEVMGSMLTQRGSVATDRQDIANTFAAFYENLYAKVNETLDDYTFNFDFDRADKPKISGDEVQAAIKFMKNKKCADEAGVIKEALAYGGTDLADELTDSFNSILFGTSTIPASWRASKISVRFKNR